MSNDYSMLHNQRGGALIIFILILVLAGSTALFSMLDGIGLKNERDKNTSTVFAESKAALIGFSIKAVSAGARPGNLIVPDSLTETPANYDGSADGGCLDANSSNGLPLINSDINMRCLGRLPWKDLGVSINSPTESDLSGIMPWYAVSGNLVDPTCLTILNPNTLRLINNSALTILDCSGATLPYPWLTVRDSGGNVISNRVAAVVIIPGAARGTQSRPIATLGGAGQYLDTIVVPEGCTIPCVPGTYSNADMDNDFILASESMPIALANNFNDQLIYITIEELMAAVTTRAAGEARSVLNRYNSQNSHYPYAAALGSVVGNFISSGVSASGMLPIDGTDACTCSSSVSCTCNYNLVGSVSHTRSSGGSYAVNSGLCTRSGRTCTCTGAGQCRNNSSSRTFTCLTGGTCTFVGSGTNTLFTYTPRLPHGNILSPTAGCTVASGNATCNVNGAFRVGLNVPLWFTENLWQEYFYYEWSASSNLQLGSHGNLAAVLIGTGNEIANAPYAVKGSAQTRPSNNLSDYLDSGNNVNGDVLYDAIGTSRSSSYNDQMFIVAP